MMQPSMNFFDHHKFSVLVTNNPASAALYIAGAAVDYVISPQAIELPIHSPGEGAKFTDVACGRAHTVIATDKAGKL